MVHNTRTRNPSSRSPSGLASVTDRSTSAEIAETIVPPVEYPAAEAVDCMQLFSSTVIGVFARPQRRNTDQMP